VIPVTVVVVDFDGAPIDDARVQITRERRDDDETKPPVHDATTDATGIVVVHVGGTGKWTATVRHPLYKTEEVERDLADAGRTYAIAASLERKLPKAGAKSAQGAVETPKASEVGGPGRAPSSSSASPTLTPTTSTTGPAEGSAPVIPTEPATSVEAPADFGGHWRHVSGTTLDLVQKGTTVTGSWSHLDSRVTGTVRGRIFEFTTTSPKGLDCEGQVTLDAAGAAFFGEARVTRSASDVGRRFHFDAERAK
jgi:hypothetical protein